MLLASREIHIDINAHCSHIVSHLLGLMANTGVMAVVDESQHDYIYQQSLVKKASACVAFIWPSSPPLWLTTQQQPSLSHHMSDIIFLC